MRMQSCNATVQHKVQWRRRGRSRWCLRTPCCRSVGSGWPWNGSVPQKQRLRSVEHPAPLARGLRQAIRARLARYSAPANHRVRLGPRATAARALPETTTTTRAEARSPCPARPPWKRGAAPRTLTSHPPKPRPQVFLMLLEQVWLGEGHGVHQEGVLAKPGHATQEVAGPPHLVWPSPLLKGSPRKAGLRLHGCKGRAGFLSSMRCRWQAAAAAFWMAWRMGSRSCCCALLNGRRGTRGIGCHHYPWICCLKRRPRPCWRTPSGTVCCCATWQQLSLARPFPMPLVSRQTSKRPAATSFWRWITWGCWTSLMTRSWRR
mmetsp:Transcript_29327/g.76035  ORF Transcript_29327/g.76035 Transcript_29327/m.76035 type:complete len:319 (-) Transcript_29327:2699-3655(-)